MTTTATHFDPFLLDLMWYAYCAGPDVDVIHCEWLEALSLAGI